MPTPSPLTLFSGKLNLLILSFSLTVSSAGAQCFCEKDSTLADFVICDTTEFDNKARIFWNFDCDSAWLSFQSPKGDIEEIFTLSDGMQNLATRLGYSYVAEFNKHFLIQNNVISGCCSPPDYRLFDKSTGVELRNLGRIIYYSDDRSSPFIISFTGSNYEEDLVVGYYDSLTIYNTLTEKEYKIAIPGGSLNNTLKKSGLNYPEQLIEETVMTATSFSFTHYTNDPSKSAKTKKITIDLKPFLN